MQRLLRGSMDQPGYQALLVNLAAIYAALEPAWQRHSSHPVLASTFSTRLLRSAALRADLRTLARSQDVEPAPLQPATWSYVHRLEALDAAHPELLLAHAYVRYLGDLNGGQLLKVAVRRCFALPDHAGTSFYDFGDAAVTAELARRFRQGLADLVVEADLQDALVDEARRSFELHAAMFDQLSAGYATPVDIAAVARA